MKKKLGKCTLGFIALSLSLIVTSCNQLFNAKIDDSFDNSSISTSRAASGSTTVYNVLKSDSAATTYNSTYDMYIVNGAKMTNDWSFFRLDLSKFDYQTVYIDFQTSIQVKNNTNSSAKLEWVVKTADGYKTIASKTFGKGSSDWTRMSGSNTYTFGESAKLYLATYGLSYKDFVVTIADTSVKVTSSSSSGDYSDTPNTPYIPDVPSSSSAKKITFTGADFANVTTTSNLYSNDFTLYATSEKDVKISSSNTIYQDKAFQKVINLNGGGKYGQYRAIGFKAKKGSKVTVYAKAGGTGRYLALASSKGIENQYEISTSISVYSYTTNSDDTYNLFSTKNGISIFAVIVEIPGDSGSSSGDNPGTDTGSSTDVTTEKDEGFASGTQAVMGDFICDATYTTYDASSNSYKLQFPASNKTSTIFKLDLSDYALKVVDVDISADITGISGNLTLNWYMVDRDDVLYSIKRPGGPKNSNNITKMDVSLKNLKGSKEKYLYLKNIESDGTLSSLQINNVKVTITPHSTTPTPTDPISDTSMIDNGFISGNETVLGDFICDAEKTTYDSSSKSYTIITNTTYKAAPTLLKIDLSKYNGKKVFVEVNANINGFCGYQNLNWILSTTKQSLSSTVFNFSPNSTEKTSVMNFKSVPIDVTSDTYLYLRDIEGKSSIASITFSSVSVKITELENPSTPSTDEKPKNVITGKDLFIHDTSLFYVAAEDTFKILINNQNLTKDLLSIDFSKYIGKSVSLAYSSTISVECATDCEFGWFVNDSSKPISTVKISASESNVEKKCAFKNSSAINSNTKITLKLISGSGITKPVIIKNPSLTVITVK